MSTLFRMAQTQATDSQKAVKYFQSSSSVATSVRCHDSLMMKC